MSRKTNAKHEPDSDVVMGLWDHIEDLRGSVLKSLGALCAGTAVGFALASPAYEVLSRPLKHLGREIVELVFTSPLDAFMARLKVALAVGFVLALPLILTFTWKFIAPGLRKNEKQIVFLAVAIGTVLFCAGATFGYFMLSIGLEALIKMGLSGSGARHLWTLDAYLGFCLRFMLAFGVVFELPIVIVVLSRLGVVTTADLRRHRRYAILGAFIVGGILTPPDALTQTMLAVPLLVMYELSIQVSAAMDRRKNRENPEGEATVLENQTEK
jgi:sec-independent protein translocase protein TatC